MHITRSRHLSFSISLAPAYRTHQVTSLYISTSARDHLLSCNGTRTLFCSHLSGRRPAPAPRSLIPPLCQAHVWKTPPRNVFGFQGQSAWRLAYLRHPRKKRGLRCYSILFSGQRGISCPLRVVLPISSLTWLWCMCCCSCPTRRRLPSNVIPVGDV